MGSSKSAIEIVLTAVDQGVKSTLTGINSALNSVERSTKAYTSTMSSLTGASNTFLSTITQIAAAIGGANLFGKAATGAIEFNSTVENSKIGMAALLRSFLDFPPGADEMATSMAMAGDIQKKLQIEGLKTTATYQELLAALQQGLGPALAAGFSTDQVVAFTAAMVQAAGAIGVPMNQLGQEVRSILDGTIGADSRVAKVLGVTNEKMKEMISSGKGFDFLMDKLKAFTLAGDQLGKTFSGSLSNLKDAFQLAFGTGLEGAFVSLTGFIQKVQGALVTIDKEASTFTFNEKIMAALDQVDAKLSQFLSSFSSADLSGMMASFIAAMGELAVIALDVAKGLGELWNAIGPLAPALVEITAKFFLWKTALSLLLSMPLTLAKNVIALNAGFAAMTGMSFVQWGTSVVTALRGISLATMSVTTAMGAAAGATLALFAGYKVGEWLAMHNELKGVADATKDLGFNQRLIAKQFLEISKATGVTVTSLEEVKKAVDEGRIHQDEATAEWKAGAKGQAEATKKAGEEIKLTQKQVAQAQKEALDTMRDKYRSYVDEIKGLDKQIASSSQDTYAQLREMARTGMSGIDAWKDLKKQADDYKQAAVDAAAAGDFQAAISNAKLAQQTYAQLNTEVKSGDTVLISQPQALKKAMAGVKEAADIGLAAMKSQKEVAAKGLADLANTPGFDKLKETMSEVEVAWLDNWLKMREGASKEIETVNAKIVELTQDRYVTVYVREVVQKAMGGLISGVQKFARGGKLAGYGGGDRISALLEAGEFVIRKEAVARFGAGLFHQLNSLRVPEIPHFATGGMVGGSAAGGVVQNYNLSVSFAGNVSPMSQTTARANARQIMSELERMNRRSS